jgi:hypothetical protein
MLAASILLCRRLSAIVARRYRLMQIAFKPYRPELHYMRGPGPKWQAKQQGRPKSGAR